jgi:hypothetical protein
LAIIFNSVGGTTLALFQLRPPQLIAYEAMWKQLVSVDAFAFVDWSSFVLSTSHIIFFCISYFYLRGAIAGGIPETASRANPNANNDCP